MQQIPRDWIDLGSSDVDGCDGLTPSSFSGDAEQASSTHLELSNIKSPRRALTRQQFAIEWVHDIDLQRSAAWLIEDLFENGPYLAILWGKSHTGKSYIAADLASAVASAPTWAGKKVQNGLSVYVSGEGQTDQRRRLKAQFKERGGKSIPLAFIDEMPDLCGSATVVEQLIRSIGQAAQECGQAPSFIVFDTLARAMAGGDENSSRDMGMLIRNVSVIQQVFQCAALFVHHANKRNELRGHSSLFAAADLVLQLCMKSGRRLKVEKLRGGQSGGHLEFAIEDYSVDGVPTAIARPSVWKGEGVTAMRMQSELDLTPPALTLLNILREVIGQNASGDLAFVRERAVRSLTSSDKTDTAAKAFKRNIEKLVKLRFITISGERFKLIGHAGHAGHLSDMDKCTNPTKTEGH